jgi:hypothetical protein
LERREKIARFEDYLRWAEDLKMPHVPPLPEHKFEAGSNECLEVASEAEQVHNAVEIASLQAEALLVSFVNTQLLNDNAQASDSLEDEQEEDEDEEVADAVRDCTCPS